MRKRWNNKSVLFSIPSGSVQYLKIYTVFILIFKQWQLDALHNGSSLLHWAILKVSARSSDVLYHIYRPRCCHIPSLATNGSSAPVCLSVCVWQRPVVFPALSLFTRRPLWLRAAAVALEWNDGNIFVLHAVSYDLNIDSVCLCRCHICDSTSSFSLGFCKVGDHFEFDPQQTEATTVSHSQICMFRFLLRDLSKPMIQL